MKTIKSISGMALFALLLMACGQAPSPDSSSSQEPEKQERSGQAYVQDDEGQPNCLQIALGSPDHTSLVAAVQAAELENALVNAGPLTVFAPTDAAFSALPEGTVESLLQPENKDALANILKYHVTPGNLKADFITRFKKLGQANGQDLKVEVVDGKPMVGGANIVASVPAGNGIVHVVDAVLLPPSE